MDSEEDAKTGEFIPRASDKEIIASAIGLVLEATKHGVLKTGRNNHGGYNYASEDDALNVVRPAMGQAGLILMPSTVGPARIEHGQTKNGNSNVTAYVTMEYTLVHISGAVWPEKPRSEGMATDTQDKAVAQAITSAHKYFLLKFFMLATDEDPDRDKADNANGGAGAPNKDEGSPFSSSQENSPAPQNQSESGSTEKKKSTVDLASERFNEAILRGGLDELNNWWGENKDAVQEKATPKQWDFILDKLKKARIEAGGAEQEPSPFHHMKARMKEYFDNTEETRGFYDDYIADIEALPAELQDDLSDYADSLAKGEDSR